MATSTTFTSESVCAGHPDKICDRISDVILDAVLKKDPNGRVAVETLVTHDQIILAGEVKTHSPPNYEQLARNAIKSLGYTNESRHFSHKSPLTAFIHTQSPEIAIGVDAEGAGDQGMMFGYACNETTSLMPLPISMAHALAKKIDDVREDGTIPYLRPDGKTQVTVAYQNGKPVGVQKVVVAVPHTESTSLQQVKKDIYKKVIIPIMHAYKLSISEDQLIVNGTGVWHYGGPSADTGLTGRKIIVDTYGGYARVGGGCFSGKDPTKVDRSAAYAARYIAKNIVANGLAERAEVRLAYFIGAKKPLMQEVETFGTEKTNQKKIKDFMAKLLDTSVAGIINHLDLKRPLYTETAAYGHFGRPEFPWENIVHPS